MSISELQRRLDTDPLLKNISGLGIDRTMATGLVRRGPWMTRVVIFQIAMPLLITLSAWLMPNSPWRTTKKSTRDVLAATFGVGPPLSERPKGVYLDGSKIGQKSAEAEDVEKQRLLWRDTVRCAQLKDSETVLQL